MSGAYPDIAKQQIDERQEKQKTIREKRKEPKVLGLAQKTQLPRYPRNIRIDNKDCANQADQRELT